MFCLVFGVVLCVFWLLCVFGFWFLRYFSEKLVGKRRVVFGVVLCVFGFYFLRYFSEKLD